MTGSEIYYLILRLVHVPFGILWAGGTFLVALGVGPSAQATAPESGKFMMNFGPRFGRIAAGSGVLVLLSGTLLYERVTGGLQGASISTPYGLSLLIGGISAYVGFFYALATLARNNARVEQIGKEMAQAGGPPSAEQAAELRTLGEKNGAAGRIVAILLVIVVVGMAAAEAL